MDIQRFEVANLGKYKAQGLVDDAADMAEDSDNVETDKDEALWVIEAIVAAQAELEKQLGLWVQVARGEFATFTEIGESLGVSKQAAAKKYGKTE